MSEFLLHNWQLILVMGLTAVAVVLFVVERFRVDVVALLVMAVLMVTGIISPKQGFAGFSNEATITIAAMFVLSSGLQRTGAVNALGAGLSDLMIRNYWVAMIAMMLGVGFMSAFINNTAVVAVMLPLMMSAAREADVSIMKVLMPLSFAAMFGGMCTLVGTSTNLVVSSVLEQHGKAPIGMFEMTPLGLIFVVAGILYMLTIGDKLLPESRRPPVDLVESFELSEYLTDFEVLPSSALVGESVDSSWLAEEDEIRIIEIFRDGRSLGHPSPTITFQPGDTVRIRGSAAAIQGIEDRPAIAIRALSAEDGLEERGEDVELVEAVIAPNGVLDGSTLRKAELDPDFLGHVVAIRRQRPSGLIPGRKDRTVFHTDLRDEELQAGDVLLLQSDSAEIEALQQHPEFILATEIGLPKFRTEKTIPAVLTVAAVILGATVGPWHISVTATAGCVLLLVFGIISIEEAYEDINWEVIFLLAGLLPLGTALEETGGIEILSGALIQTLGGYGEGAVLGGLYLLTALLTGFMSNQATAILFTPVAIETAAELGSVSYRPLVIAVAFAASASFLTPVGYQTNTMIYGAGQYKFSDFLRVGTALTLLFWGIAWFMIPVIWPF